MGDPPPSPARASTRRAAWLGLLVLLGGIALTVAASLVTGPAFDEDRRIGAARRATDLVRAVADFGPSAMTSSSARAIYDELSPFGALPAIVSGWIGDVLATARLLDRLVAARLGWLLWTSLAPGALYLIVERSRGARTAALAASVLLSMPRWTHAAAMARDAAVVGSIWVLALAAYLRSLPPPIDARRQGLRSRFRWAAPVLALVLGLGLATSLATLWVLPLITAHYLGLRGKALFRTRRRGVVPLPAAFLYALVITPAVMVLCAPSLWRGGVTVVAEWLFASLAPTIEPVLYSGGPIVSVADVPATYAARWVLATTPLLILLLAVAGAAALGADFLAARRGARPHDAFGLGLLLALATFAGMGGPALTPRVLTRFPPRTEALLPLLAVAAAVAIERLATRLVGERRRVLVVLGAALALLASGLVGLPTASASFGLLAGGTGKAIEGRMWTVGDGSEVAPLARAIDALGAPRVSIDAPDVPRGYFALLGRVDRLRARVEPGRRVSGSLVLSRGPHDRAIATVTRDGSALWSLARR